MTPLTEPLSREQVRAWRRENPGFRFDATHPWWTLFLAVPVLLIGLAYLGIGIILFATGTAVRGASPIALVIPFLFTVVIVVALVASVINGRGHEERLVRLVRFAQANGFSYSRSDDEPSYPGLIFRIGRRRQAVDHILRSAPRFLDLGNFRYVVGAGKNTRTRTWGFMALHLDRRIPHMLLDARANNFLGSNLPTAFSKDQVLSLEGDFDRHFTLYCPREYERDALYVFTPDLMALLIDEAGAFDVEVIDDWMFVYSQVPFRMGDPATLMRLLRIVDTVGAKTLDRTDYYADERIGNRAVNLVAPQGMRLRRGIPWAVVLAVVASVAMFLWIAIGAPPR
ncbi:MAG: hypothetical protein DI534_12810 [Leifsonia xyli]|nr:MAG: hypothetical protein DI534_12810 [Leifsonia xyli]